MTLEGGGVCSRGVGTRDTVVPATFSHSFSFFMMDSLPDTILFILVWAAEIESPYLSCDDPVFS